MSCRRHASPRQLIRRSAAPPSDSLARRHIAVSGSKRLRFEKFRIWKSKEVAGELMIDSSSSLKLRRDK
jgi:hypothetical protein